MHNSIDHLTALTKVLQQREEWLELLNAIGEPILVTSLDGVVIAVNTSAEGLFLRKWSDMIGHPVEDFMPERLRYKHVTHRQHYSLCPVNREMGTDVEIAVLRSDGQEVPVRIFLSPVVLKGGCVIVATIRRKSIS